MRKPLILLVIAASACIGGVFVTKAYYRVNPQFRQIAVGSMGMCGDGFGGFGAFESYDGERLIYAGIRFSSIEAAGRCFNSTIQQGITILSRENLLDQTGSTVVGERVTVHSGLDGPDSGIILSREGDYLIQNSFDIAQTCVDLRKTGETVLIL